MLNITKKTQAHDTIAKAKSQQDFSSLNKITLHNYRVFMRI